MKHALSFLLILILSGGAAAREALMPDSSVSGFYAWENARDGILKVPAEKFRDRACKKHFWEKHRTLVTEQKRRFMIFEIVFEKTRKNSRLPSQKAAEQALERIFGTEDGVDTFPELVYAIVPSEEHGLADIPALNRIRAFVKSRWDIPVFQWLSEPLSPTLELEADGWIFDAYSISGEKFYRHAEKFAMTGKPVFPILWAAEPGMDGYYAKGGFPALKKNAEQKFAYCRALNLPVFLFAVCKEHGSVGCWMSDKEPFLTLRAFFDTLLRSTPEKPVISDPENIFVIPENGVFQWEETFRNFDFAERASVENGTPLLTRKGLVFRGQEVLRWKFESPDTLRAMELTALFEGENAVLGVSDNGITWKNRTLFSGEKARFSIAGRKEFHIRIQGKGICLNELKMRVRGIPSHDKCVELSPDSRGIYFLKEDFTLNRFAETVRTHKGASAISFGKNFLGIPGVPGRRAVWSGVQKIRFSGVKPETVTLRVPCSADKRNWNCSIRVGLSADGKKPVYVSSDPAENHNQILTPTLTIPGGMRECLLHFELTNGSGVYRANLFPGRICGYELQAGPSG